MPIAMEFDYDIFKLQIPQYSDPILYPEEQLQANWDQATSYISNEEGYCGLNLKDLRLALDLMTAHITSIADSIAANGSAPSYQLASASIDKVSVGALNSPNNDSQWRWWLGTTSYGQRLLALLATKIVGGLYITPSCFGYGFGGFY